MRPYFFYFILFVILILLAAACDNFEKTHHCGYHRKIKENILLIGLGEIDRESRDHQGLKTFKLILYGLNGRTAGSRKVELRYDGKGQKE